MIARIATVAVAAAAGLVFSALTWVPAASAAQITRFSPEGVNPQVRQVSVRFDEPMVPMGDLKAAAPASVSCVGGVGGSGRWVNATNWVYDFERDLPPGVRCAVQISPALKSVAGKAYVGKSEYRFETGGPIVISARPSGGQVEEDQVFALRFNGAATGGSIRAHVWCQAEGLGERIPVRLLAGKERDSVIEALNWKEVAKREGDAVHLLACQQRLPAGARMQLVLDAGIATPSGLATTAARRFDFQVRDAFAAGFTCERERAEAPCTPLRPMTVTFTAPISRKAAESIVMKTPTGNKIPSFNPDEAPDAPVSTVTFKGPFPEKASLTIEAPRDLKDESGRALSNADLFPIKLTTAALPPLAKFAAAPFGVVERFADVPRGKSPNDFPPLLPVTLRNVEADLPTLAVRAEAGTVARLKVDDDGAILRWFGMVKRMHENSWTKEQMAAIRAGQAPYSVQSPRNALSIETRSVSLLDGVAGAKKLDIPKSTDTTLRPFEVVGIPLPEPGFHVVEIASPMLGAALLGKKAPMYVRTAALVTNLGVHFKLARGEADGDMSGLAWVTTLDDGKPVANAKVAVRSCEGELLGQGTTDATGVVRFAKLADRRYKDCANGMNGYFVSARIDADHAQARGKADMAFVMSDWNRGIETWRFNVPTDLSPKQTVRAHTVFDRTLLRAGETVSMKHLIRNETGQGFALPQAMPAKLLITHEGSGQKYEMPLTWRATATGGRSAENLFQVPPSAKLGVYDVALVYDNDRTLDSGSFRVEAFRLPVLSGTLSVTKDPKAKGNALVAPAEVPVGVEIHYLNGGGAAGLPVRLSALMRNKSVSFADYDDYAFNPPRAQQQSSSGEEEDDQDSDSSRDESEKLVADKLPLTLDKDGNGRLAVKNLPKVDAPRDLVLEAGFADPNGEIQTLRQTVPLWPSAVVVGIRAANWVSVSQKLAVHVVVLDTQGKPVAESPVQIKARARITTSARKRVVGGFYRYDNRSETKDLGVVCDTRTDTQGRARCEVALSQAGEVELIGNARDANGRVAQAATTVWVTRQGELWFGGENHDRMDVLPEKKAYAPGDTAVFQVRMPFRRATALVAVEREGILDTQVVELSGNDPTIKLKVKPEWGPNVYVSVLSLRGRLREVPWYSFFQWGWRQPLDWWRAFRSEGREYVAPSPLVDLSKPAFRLGLAQIRVGNDAYRLDVSVTPDKASYPVRGKARVTVQVKLPDGKPAANGEVALAAVDQALLELMPNTSWNLLDAMVQPRSYGVETSTAQMEIIGRRHYGRKAVPAGGGGGKSPTRELFDTLLLWNPRVQLDAEGKATLDVPLNDSLTSFRIVAVADLGVNRFGSGSASIAATQDLQMISGLPPLVREEDKYRAMFTLRNTTQRTMTVEATARATLVDAQTLPVQTVQIPAGEAREIGWDITAPALLAYSRSGTIMWEVAAAEKGTGGVSDKLKVSQQIVPAVPVTVQQAMLAQLTPNMSVPVPVQAPAGALADPTGKLRGGMQVSLQSSLAGGMPGVREWFRNYPFSCLEQRSSKSLGLGDAAAWDALMAQLPSYLDTNGLASYFPLRSDSQSGSEVLTAYLLSIADEASGAGLPMRIPDAQREQMERGLTAFVEGRISPPRWAPSSATMDLDVRKLAAIEALSRSGKAQGRMLGSIQILPDQWPTSALIDWLAILSRVQDIPDRDKRIADATQLLRSRLTVQGTRLVFSTERTDNWWWLMSGGDVNAAKLLALASQLPGWKEDVPQLVTGLLGRQTLGAWSTTTSNAWGVMAIRRYAQVYEKTPVAGSARATLGDVSRTLDWSKATHQDGVASGMVDLSWPAASAKAPATMQVEQLGTGRPWATVRALAAVPLREPVAAGYRIRRSVSPVEQAVAGKWSRGDTYRVKLDIDAQADMTWVVVSDPVPTGATILGSGLGRDSVIATRDQKSAWSDFTERTPEAYREYFGYVPKGSLSVEYTVRLNNAGEFALPPTRVEAMYAPDVFGESPNAKLTVGAAK